MAQQEEVDCGVYIDAPIIYFFRNGCVPALSSIIVQEFKNAKHVKYFVENSLKQSQEPQNFHPQVNNHRQVENMTLYEYLKIVHKIGKREEQKKKKAEGKTMADNVEVTERREAAPDTCGTQLLNNLEENKNVLSSVLISQLLDTSLCHEALGYIVELDVTFLCYLLINDIIKFPLNVELCRAINDIKDIRNDVYHFGSTCNLKYIDMCKKLNMLFNSAKVLFRYLNKPLDIIERIKQDSLKQIKASVDKFSGPILGTLKQEIHTNYRSPKHHVLPDIEHFRRGSQPRTAVESLEEFKKFIQDCRSDELQKARPIMICGAPGSGKTSLLENLTEAFCKDSDKYFSLILYLGASCRMYRSIFWKEVCESIINLCPETVSKFGKELVNHVIKMHADNILFLVDWNIQYQGDILLDVERGTWVISCQGFPEVPSYSHVLRVLPLCETRVEQILHCISPNADEVGHILKLYEECSYKGLLNSPDIVSIFCTIGTSVPFDKMLEYFVNKKVGNFAYSEKELTKLGRVAFNSILKNGKFYAEKDLCEIRQEVKDQFVEYHDKYASFRYRVIEDFMAAKYVIVNPEEACSKWLNQVPLFKRVFRFVCSMWLENGNNIQTFLPFIKSYLLKLLGNEKSDKKTNRKLKNKYIVPKKSDKQINTVEPMDVDIPPDAVSTANCCPIDNMEKFGNASKFTKWPYIVKLADDCHYHQEVMKVLAKILVSKSSWLFKCKCLDESVIEKIGNILKYIRVTNPLTITLESGPNTKILNNIWNMLNTLTELHHHTSVKIMIVHKETLPIPHNKMLKELSYAITKYCDTPLNITKYVGPLFCSGIPQFLKCLCMRRVEVLNVCVYDIATFKEILSCTGLSCLREVIVRVDLKSDEQILEDTPKLPIPKSVPLTMTIKYFDRLQKLLNKFESPHYVESLSIYDVYIHKSFKLDLSHFKDLTRLYIRFIPGTKAAYIAPEIPAHRKSMEVEEERESRTIMEVEKKEGRMIMKRREERESRGMETEEMKENRTMDIEEERESKTMEIEQKKESRTLEIEQKKERPAVELERKRERIILVSPKEWICHLSINLILPERLERLLLRNMEYCNNSNSFLLLTYWKNSNIQRLIIEDSFLSITGVRNILKDHNDSDNRNIEQALKRHCTIDRRSSLQLREWLRKKPRLEKEERQKRRQNKPPGKELIITSQFALCNECREFPCTCPHKDWEDCKETLKDLVDLIEDVYTCDILNFSFTSEIVTVRKDMCGDLRVHCPLTKLTDGIVYNLVNDDNMHDLNSDKSPLNYIFQTLTLAQCICLEHTNLTYEGAMAVVKQLKQGKSKYCNIENVEPFSLTIKSDYHPESDDEVENSSFLNYLRNEDCLAQFNFWCCCSGRCHRIKKSIAGQIFVNDKLMP
nr:uncharacterized protein LOC123769924 isoform X1 [Procambarus clarkii]